MPVSGRFWAGWDDELQENNYANTVTGEPLAKDFWPFYPGEPNGERMENCVAVWVAKNAWNDFSCTWKSHPFCYIKTRYVLHASLCLAQFIRNMYFSSNFQIKAKTSWAP